MWNNSCSFLKDSIFFPVIQCASGFTFIMVQLRIRSPYNKRTHLSYLKQRSVSLKVKANFSSKRPASSNTSFFTIRQAPVTALTFCTVFNLPKYPASSFGACLYKCLARVFLSIYNASMLKGIVGIILISPLLLQLLFSDMFNHSFKPVRIYHFCVII